MVAMIHEGENTSFKRCFGFCFGVFDQKEISRM